MPGTGQAAADRGGGGLGVAAGHTWLGFWWFDGLHELRTRYYQGIASTPALHLLRLANWPPADGSARC